MTTSEPGGIESAIDPTLAEAKMLVTPSFFSAAMLAR